MSRTKILACLKIHILIFCSYSAFAQVNHIIVDTARKQLEMNESRLKTDTTPHKVIINNPNIARTSRIIINRAMLDSLPPRIIDGYVKDDNGNPLSGVTVTIKDTKQSTVTDEKGYYKLFSNQEVELTYSFLGYQSISLNPQKNNLLSSDGIVITANPSYELQTEKLTLNVFPVPFPDPSTFYNIPASFFNGDKTFGDIDNKLQTALDGCRYDVKKYYYVPDGFAIVTQMERMNNDGSSTMPPGRWKYSIAGDINDPISYIKSLFSAPSGDFRVFVFIVTDVDLSSNNQKITDEEVMGWLGNGFTALPQNIRQIPFDDRYHFTMLVYHYNKTGSGEDAIQVLNDPLTGRTHYEKAGLVNYLGQ